MWTETATVHTVDAFYFKWEIGSTIESLTFHPSFGSQMSADSAHKAYTGRQQLFLLFLRHVKKRITSDSVAKSRVLFLRRATPTFSALSLNRLDSCYFIYRVSGR